MTASRCSELPVDVVAQIGLIARHSDDLKSMRGVSKTWKAGSESIVTKLTISFDGPPLPVDGSLSERFPGLTSLDVGDCPMDETRLNNLQGLNQLQTLILGDSDFDTPFMMPKPAVWTQEYLSAMIALLNKRSQHAEVLLGKGLTDAGMVHLSGLPLTTLGLRSCKNITDSGLEVLRGMPFVKLDLCVCKGLSDSGLENLRGAPLKDLDLGYCEDVTDAGLEFLRGLPLTKLNLTTYKVTDAGMGCLEGMQLETLNLSECIGVTDLSLDELFWLCR